MSSPRSVLSLLALLVMISGCSRAVQPVATAPTTAPTGQKPTVRPAATTTRRATTATVAVVVTPSSTSTRAPVAPTPAPALQAHVRNGGNVRTTPATGNVVDQINAGEAVTLLAQSADGQWFQIRDLRQNIGWVHSSLLTVDPLVVAQLQGQPTPAAAVTTATPPAAAAAITTTPPAAAVATAKPVAATVGPMATPPPFVVQLPAALMTPESANATVIALILRNDRAQLVKVLAIEEMAIEEQSADQMLSIVAKGARNNGPLFSVSFLPIKRSFGLALGMTLFTYRDATVCYVAQMTDFGDAQHPKPFVPFVLTTETPERCLNI